MAIKNLDNVPLERILSSPGQMRCQKCKEDASIVLIDEGKTRHKVLCESCFKNELFEMVRESPELYLQTEEPHFAGGIKFVVKVM
jgi:hypothetical protein